MTTDELKKAAAELAVTYVKSGMIVGLGTGSTIQFALERIAELLKIGELKNIFGIPSSLQTEREAKRLGIPLATLDEYPEIDLTIDGADEIAFGFAESYSDPVLTGEESLNNFAEGHVASVSTEEKTPAKKSTNDIYLIKGGGGALLREKVIAQASKEEIIIIDENKFSNVLGTKWAVPIEVIPFALNAEVEFLKSMNAVVSIRVNNDESKFKTDEGNYIIDCNFGKIKDIKALSTLLNCRAGIVEHGIFVNLVSRVIIATQEGVKEFS